MKIALVTGSYYPYCGGVETHVREIANRLVKSTRNLEVDVLTTDPSKRLPKNESVNGVDVRRFNSWAPDGAYYFSRSIRTYLLQHSNDFDVVHAHGYHAFPPLYAARAKDKNKLVFTPHYHGTGHTIFRKLLFKPYKFFGKKIFEKADKVVCVSLYEKSLVLKDFGLNEDKIEVVPNGVDLEEFKGLSKSKKSYQTILSVGRLEKYKGVHYLIEALAKMTDDVILEVVGKGPYKESLVKLASRLGVVGRVRFFEDLPRSELLQKYAHADLFVLLSKYEAYGITVAEALASNVPSIVARTSALQEWIDNKNCFGIDYEIDTKELANLIEQVMGRRVINVKIPTWDEVTQRILSVYHEILFDK